MTTLTGVAVQTLPDGRMTPAHSASYLGISEKTLANYRSRGIGPPFVKRGRIFYFKADLDAWLASGRVVSAAQSRQLAR